MDIKMMMMMMLEKACNYFFKLIYSLVKTINGAKGSDKLEWTTILNGIERINNLFV